MKTILMLFIYLVIGGCFSLKQISDEDIYGKYYYGIGSEIELRNDGTFTYLWREGLSAGITKGNWKREKSILILNSEEEPDDSLNTSYKVSEEKKNEQEGIIIKVVDENNNPLHFTACVIQINDEEKIGRSSDENGICFYGKDSSEVNKISILYVGHYRVEYKPYNVNSNYFIIKMKKEKPPYVVFTNQQWKIDFSKQSKCLIYGERSFCR